MYAITGPPTLTVMLVNAPSSIVLGINAIPALAAAPSTVIASPRLEIAFSVAPYGMSTDLMTLLAGAGNVAPFTTIFVSILSL